MRELETDLLVRVKKYRPRLEKKSEEDFFTEAFAHLLRVDDSLLVEIFKKLGIEVNLGKTISVETQVPLPNQSGRVDIEIKSEGKKIFIENKIESCVKECKDEDNKIQNQLNRYLRELNEVGDFLILITKYDEDITDDILKCPKFKGFRWSKIYDIIKKYCIEEYEKKDINYTKKYLIKQFLDLMKEEKMEPYNKITKEMIEGHNNLIDNIYKLFDELISRLEKKGNQITGKKPGVSRDYIDRNFSFKNVRFSITFLGDVFKLYVERKKLTSEQQNVLKNRGFKSTSNYLSKPFEINPDFFDLTSEEQVEKLDEFYQENFNIVKEEIEKIKRD